MCGKKGTLRSARTMCSYKTYKGKRLWVTVSYTLGRSYLGGFKNDIAGVCGSCTRNIHLKMAFHSTVAKITWYLWRRWFINNS